MNIQTPVIEKLHRMRSGELPADPYRFPFWTPEQKPASETEAEAATDAKPLPPIIEVPPRDLGEEVAELCEPVSAYLDGFVIAEQPDHFSDGYRNPLSTERYAQPAPSPEVVAFEARKAALLRDFGTWKNELRNFLADHRTWRTAELRAEYEIAWQKAREQKAVVASLATKINEGGEELRRLKAELSTARSKANAHAAEKPILASLPTQTQIDVWQAILVELRRLFPPWEQRDDLLGISEAVGPHVYLRQHREVKVVCRHSPYSNSCFVTCASGRDVLAFIRFWRAVARKPPN